MTVEKVNLGSYTITKHVEDLEHKYEVLSSQEDGGYLVNAPDGKLIEVSADGKFDKNKNSSTPILVGEYGSAQSIQPDTKVYALDKTVWTIKTEQITKYAATGNDDEYKFVSTLANKEAAELDFIWLSPRRIVGYGNYRVKTCTTETACLKKGVQIFELNSEDKIEHRKIQIKEDNYGLGKDKVIGGFRVLTDGNKCFWLWNAAGELQFVKSEDQPQAGKKIWKSWKYQLTFSNTGTEIVEFDFDIAVSPEGGGLLPPKYIAVIAKGEDGKLGLYTALPD